MKQESRACWGSHANRPSLSVLPHCNAGHSLGARRGPLGFGRTCRKLLQNNMLWRSHWKSELAKVPSGTFACSSFMKQDADHCNPNKGIAGFNSIRLYFNLLRMCLLWFDILQRCAILCTSISLEIIAVRRQL